MYESTYYAPGAMINDGAANKTKQNKKPPKTQRKESKRQTKKLT